MAKKIDGARVTYVVTIEVKGRSRRAIRDYADLIEAKLDNAVLQLDPRRIKDWDSSVQIELHEVSENGD